MERCYGHLPSDEQLPKRGGGQSAASVLCEEEATPLGF